MQHVHSLVCNHFQILDLKIFFFQKVQLIQKWLNLYPEDYVDMKMRFRLRAKVLENIQALGTEASPLKEELRSTLRLSEQAHATIRPPSYYVEQSVKQIEATHPKETVSQQLNRSRSMMIKDLPDLLPQSPASPLARLKSYARLTTSTPPVVVSEVKHVEPLMSPIVDRPMGSIHETLKAQHYDPFSDTLHHRVHHHIDRYTIRNSTLFKICPH